MLLRCVSCHFTTGCEKLTPLFNRLESSLGFADESALTSEVNCLQTIKDLLFFQCLVLFLF